MNDFDDDSSNVWGTRSAAESPEEPLASTSSHTSQIPAAARPRQPSDSSAFNPADAWSANGEGTSKSTLQLESDDDDDEETFEDAVSKIKLQRQGSPESMSVTDDPQTLSKRASIPPESIPAPAFSLAGPSSSTAQGQAQGQFDDFPDDDYGVKEEEPSGDAIDDDDDDFGEMGDAGGDDDDFGDFGDFDEAGGQGQEKDLSFGDRDEGVQPTSQQPYASEPPQASTYGTAAATAHLPLPDFATSMEASHIRPIITQYYEAAFGKEALYGWLDDSRPERHIEGPGLILHDQKSKDLYKSLVESSPEETLLRLTEERGGSGIDFKRSHFRYEALKALGIPVDLDDFTSVKKRREMPSIRTTIPSPTRTRTASPTSAAPAQSTSKHLNGTQNRPNRTPSPVPRYGASTGSSAAKPSSNGSRNKDKGPALPPLPPIDLSKAYELANFPSTEMNFKTNAELDVLRKELQEVAIDASNHLTALLERREILQGLNESYNAMIQDLVMAAQKMRSSGSGAKPSIRRANSGHSAPTSARHSTSSPSAAPAATTSTGSKFWGSGSSRPNSRPSSPAPPPAINTNLKSSLSRSSAGGTAGQASPERRRSLW